MILSTLAILLPLSLPAYSPASSSTEIVERGAFILHHYKKPTGRETYTLSLDRGRLELRSSFDYTDRGTNVALTAALRLRDDLTPEHFEATGRTSRFTELDVSVAVDGRSATVLESGKERRVAVADRFFMIAGYAPIAVQMMLLPF